MNKKLFFLLFCIVLVTILPTFAQSMDTMIIVFDYSENINTEGLSIDAITQASMAGDQLREVGNLLVMRDVLEERLGIDAYSLHVEEVYAPDYFEMVGPAQEDKRQNRQFTFKEELPDLDGIRTLYFGTPIWWYDVPQPVYQYFSEADLSGINIVFFSINRGSNNSRAVQVLRQLQPDSNLIGEISINAATDNEQAKISFTAFLDSLK